MSQRQRYNTPLGIPVQGNPTLSVYGVTPLGIPVAGMSVPIGCFGPYACSLMTFDGGHTWFDQSGHQVVQTCQPRQYIAPRQYVVPHQAFSTSGTVSTSSGTVSTSSGTVSTSSGPVAMTSGPVAMTSGPVAMTSGPVAMTSGHGVNEQTTLPKISQSHPEIQETGKFDEFSGWEAVSIGGKLASIPVGNRSYTFNTARTSVVVVVEKKNGGMWSNTYNI